MLLTEEGPGQFKGDLKDVTKQGDRSESQADEELYPCQWAALKRLQCFVRTGEKTLLSLLWNKGRLDTRLQASNGLHRDVVELMEKQASATTIGEKVGFHTSAE